MSDQATDPRNGLDAFQAEIQADLDRQVLETYGEQVWRHWRHPTRRGAPPRTNGHGNVTGACGDTLEIFICVEGGVVRHAGFITDGCGASQACGSAVADMAVGKAPEALDGLDGRQVLEALGGLPEDDSHCAFLAANALCAALDDWRARDGKGSRQGEGS